MVKSVITTYEKYYLEIVSAIQKKTLIGADSMFVWAAAHQPELYAQERALDEELNALWNNPPPAPSQEGNIKSPLSGGDSGVGFEAFKAKVLAWGRVVLMIYKKFSEIRI